jgi:dihydrofolate reductase
MKISLIAAMAEDRVIGRDNAMPWYLPADLKHFKAITLGKPVIMGRKTYESIGKALPSRQNIVISRSKDYQLDDACVVPSCDDAIAEAQKTSDDLMIIGGGSIYEALLDKATHLHLTFIKLVVEGDTRFPDWQSVGQWKEIGRELHKADEKNKYDYEFVSFERA